MAVMFILGASVNQAILQHCFFCFSNTGADAAITTLLPTLQRFSYNGAVDWSTTCFCCESVSQNGDSFVIAQREFQREFRIHRSRAVPLPMPSRPGFETSSLLVLH